MSETRSPNGFSAAPLFQNLDSSIKLSCLNDATVAKLIASLSAAEAAWKQARDDGEILKNALNELTTAVRGDYCALQQSCCSDPISAIRQRSLMDVMAAAVLLADCLGVKAEELPEIVRDSKCQVIGESHQCVPNERTSCINWGDLGCGTFTPSK